MCEVASWLPLAVADTLRDSRSAPVLAWLHVIRDSMEEYDPLITITSNTVDDEEVNTPDSAFDDILSQLGKEIFKLDEYQRNLAPPKNEQVSLSILNLFDECINEIKTENKLDDPTENREHVCDMGTVSNEEEPVISAVVMNGCLEDCSVCESTMSDGTFVTSTPAKTNGNNQVTYSNKVPIPLPRTRLMISQSSSAVCEPTDTRPVPIPMKRTISESDSESTCWSYKDYSTDENEDRKEYAAVWSHSSGYHNSDEILRRVLSQNRATVSRLSFDTVSEFTPAEYTVYALNECDAEVGDRCAGGRSPARSVAAMTPDRPVDDGYEPVRDAITTDENIYEEIEYGYSYTDEGCSCGGSVEVESCSMSTSFEEVGRESPLYANLRDHDAYLIPNDVIAWKNSLLDPFYNEDEEDEWITPEECAVYSRDQRPPLVIPRITQYRGQRQERYLPPTTVAHSYPEDTFQEPSSVKSSVRQFERLPQWSPVPDRGLDLDHYSKSSSNSPRAVRLLSRSRLAGSTENLLARRPNHLNLASSSGDSLDVEVREREPVVRNRKSRSMIGPKHAVGPPVPVPRIMLNSPSIETTPFQATVVQEGPIKRTKFAENTKKCKKNWQDCYMILTQTALVFYKDQKTYQQYRSSKLYKPVTPPSPTAPRAELVLALRNASIAQCIQMHTRRHSRSILLMVGQDYYLLQDETEEGAKRWLNRIKNVIYNLGPPTEDEPTLNSQSSNTDLESIGRTPPATRHNIRNKQKGGGSSNEDLSDSTEASIQKSHVRSRLRKFFAKRPAMEVLVKKGIYKDEPVFGRNLEEVCPPTSPRVPQFVVSCISEIEKSEENMTTDGLYRASGNLSQVQKIRLEIDQNNISVLEDNPDIHVLTGSLKLFFRELKEPLIPWDMFDRVLEACSLKPRESRVKEFRDIVNSLPPCNRDTLKYLLEHLLRVTNYSEKNRMHTANLAIVFGPTLLWAPQHMAHNIAVNCIQQNNVVDILLTDFKEIFNEDSKSKKKT